MKRMFERTIGAIFAAILLTGCSSEESRNGELPQLLLSSLKDVAAARQTGPLEKIDLPASELAKVKVPLIQVNPDIRGGSDFLRRVQSRRDSTGGQFEIWESSDKAQIFLRNGVVVGSRGVGGDIISADAASTGRALEQRALSEGLRSFVVSDGDNTTTDYRFLCKVTNRGREKISVSNQSFDVDRLQEVCVDADDGANKLRNDFWVERATGLVRKSRQWMGPRVGYFEIILLKN